MFIHANYDDTNHKMLCYNGSLHAICQNVYRHNDCN